jgi:hypothetical protein
MSTVTITIIAANLLHAQTLLAALSSAGHNPAVAPDLPPPEPEPQAPAETAAEMQKRVNRQLAAANARAAKAAKAAEQPEPTPGDTSLMGPAEPSPVEANGAGDQIEDLGLIDPSMSPAEAKEAGLVLVRECYAAGKVAEVKALQKEWQVAKFYDVPDVKGHEFFQRVMKMAVETGIRK